MHTTEVVIFLSVIATVIKDLHSVSYRKTHRRRSRPDPQSELNDSKRLRNTGQENLCCRLQGNLFQISWTNDSVASIPHRENAAVVSARYGFGATFK